MHREFTKEQVFDFIDGEEGFVVSHTSKPYKHDLSRETYVVKFEDSHWKFSFLSSFNNGWQLDDKINAVEVMPKEKIVIEWVEK